MIVRPLCMKTQLQNTCMFISMKWIFISLFIGKMIWIDTLSHPKGLWTSKSCKITNPLLDTTKYLSYFDNFQSKHHGVVMYLRYWSRINVSSTNHPSTKILRAMRPPQEAVTISIPWMYTSTIITLMAVAQVIQARYNATPV